MSPEETSELKIMVQVNGNSLSNSLDVSKDLALRAKQYLDEVSIDAAIVDDGARGGGDPGVLEYLSTVDSLKSLLSIVSSLFVLFINYFKYFHNIKYYGDKPSATIVLFLDSARQIDDIHVAKQTIERCICDMLYAASYLRKKLEGEFTFYKFGIKVIYGNRSIQYRVVANLTHDQHSHFSYNRIRKRLRSLPIKTSSENVFGIKYSMVCRTDSSLNATSTEGWSTMNWKKNYFFFSTNSISDYIVKIKIKYRYVQYLKQFNSSFK